MNKNESDNINQLNSIELKLRSNPVYAKMLNNLLGIGTHDNAVCASSRYDNVSIFELLSEEDMRKIYSQKSFTVTIRNAHFEKGIANLNDASDYDSFITIARKHGINLVPEERLNLRENFEEGRANILKRYQKGDQAFISSWKKYRNKYLDRQAQMNSWPLHIGAIFIEVKTEKASVYAPLLLKKVEIVIDNGKISLQSVDDALILNQKLIYLLGQKHNMHLRNPGVDEPLSFEEYFTAYSNQIHAIIQGEFNPVAGFEIRPKSRIENPIPRFHDGMALMIVSPDGGHLRNQTLKMVDNGSIYHLLNMKNEPTLIPEIRNMIINQKGIYRITPTDISQEEAIFGAFKDHAIIWGPPGTGKSQTIANIMANLMISNKKVIVTSEKKAALDVLIARLDRLSKYVLFGLTDKTTNKEQFYSQFKKLLIAINEAPETPVLDQKPVPFMPKEVSNFFEHRNALLGENLDQLAAFSEATRNLDWRTIPHYSKLFLATNKYKDLVDAIIKYDNFYTALGKTSITMKGLVIKRLPSDIKRVGECYLVFNKNKKLFKSIAYIKDLGQINRISNHIKIVNEYQGIKYKFVDDSEFIDKYLASVFRGRIEKLLKSKDEQMATLAKSFVDSIQRAHQIPFKFLAKHKAVIDKLFTIFVSTPNTLGSLINFKETFDYAIFDEASQLHVEKAIPFMGAAKKVIIAGDDKQMRPSNFFGSRDDDEEEEEEGGISANDSLLDFAQHKGLDKRTYMLTKNYRSNNSELMLFSSKHFYESRLDVIDSQAYLGRAAIDVYEVKGQWVASTNELEAKLALRAALKSMKSYKKIIILTFNTMQKNFMEDLIYDEVEFEPLQEALTQELVLLRNLENIQGDEADLVIVSVAYDKTSHLGMTYVARPEGQNALNVAISRAKNKMIIFKSIKANEVKDNDKNPSIKVFKEWLTYLESSKANRIASTSVISKNDKSFKKAWIEEVKNYMQTNYISLNLSTIKSNVPIGSYELDIAIYKPESDEFLMGVSLISYQKKVDEADMIKESEEQHFMRSKGYEIFYITEFEWNFSRNKTTNELIRKMNEVASKS